MRALNDYRLSSIRMTTDQALANEADDSQTQDPSHLQATDVMITTTIPEIFQEDSATLDLQKLLTNHESMTKGIFCVDQGLWEKIQVRTKRDMGLAFGQGKTNLQTVLAF
nr:hypothetical protein BaRGS_024057 [Batillaria attramentaria]